MEYPASFSAAPSKIGCGGGAANTDAAVGVVDLKVNLVDLILLRNDPVADAGLGGGVIGSGVPNRFFCGVDGLDVGVDDETATSFSVLLSTMTESADFSTSPYPLSTLGLLSPSPITLLAFLSPRSFGFVTLVAWPPVGDDGDGVAGVDDDPELELRGPKHFLIAFSPI